MTFIMTVWQNKVHHYIVTGENCHRKKENQNTQLSMLIPNKPNKNFKLIKKLVKFIFLFLFILSFLSNNILRLGLLHSRFLQHLNTNIVKLKQISTNTILDRRGAEV